LGDLAISGGTPAVASGAVVSRWPRVEDADVMAVESALRSERLSWIDNDDVDALQREWAAYVGVRHCIALNSGTAALHAAVAAAGVQPGDEVIVPALTFLASASSVVHHQGIPVFADIDPDTFTLDPDEFEARITPRTRAVIVVHLHGLPADLGPILDVAARHGVVVIEDAAQAHGAEYKGRRVGGIGHIGAFSIMAGKNLATAGEGGLFTTNDPGLRDKADMVKMFGERVSREGERDFNALTMGWNYRPSSVLAAFVRSQLTRLDDYTAVVQENAGYLSSRLAELPGLVPPVVPPDRTHVYHHFRLKLDPLAAGVDVPAGVFRRAVQEVLAAEGVDLIQYQNQPVPAQELFRVKEGYGKGCPWTCGVASRDVTYDGREYKQTNDVIETSLLVGTRLCMATFLDRRNVEHYANAFAKVFERPGELADHARSLHDDSEPDEAARLWS